MPKKKQVALGSEDAEEGSLAKTRSSPPVSGDASYVNSVRIRSLEERNEALKKQVEELERELSQKQEDELDICSHLQRDLAVKSERIAALEDEENKTLLENELIELRHEVSELKNRHDVEVSDLIRDFDFKYAAVRIQCDRKIDETESSVEERAMQRATRPDMNSVDDVTKKAIRLNKKRLILVENLQKEVDYLQSTVERMSRENKTLRTDLEIKEQEIHKLAEKMGQQRQFMNHQGRKLQDQANHESISKVEVDRCKQENAILKSKVVELENKLNVQTRQMQHLQ
ncbi:hypothetical protein GUITHDRAFT_140268 [Guillardia theta CCMP2712]|uniref:Cilia- and flagella-associated protein 157 n=1 Tax=Guillardia theta (strain CCMP2712) TaxID=905079 RepID=L1J5R4_GUITC|nr:hypothetical protein GUITHDRAFT_140268 [Guillardia theta CCMP2712]EKX43836.1 hypothetical protein GUITHDRAFT_140268 [Guillardia theta CCMP2712]|eukprot:XP_005830816.1 hypothetical protein GUITHDRAFT_140268 [Guillardia theta CCMP2712]